MPATNPHLQLWLKSAQVQCRSAHAGLVDEQAVWRRRQRWWTVWS